jgi:hypothetical protein
MDIDRIVYDCKKNIETRVVKRVPLKFIKEYICNRFYIAGNCLNRDNPNDIDIFPVGDTIFNIKDGVYYDFSVKIICETKNAVTTKIKYKEWEYKVQFCNYRHKTLKELVDSFDFSHVQVGAEVNGDNISVYFSDNYIISKLTQTSEYIGSCYPLSSLIRINKYINRGDFNGKSYMFSLFKILHDIIKRGFHNYEDFKDQLDAVDLGLLPEDLSELDNGILISLYQELKK